MDDDTVPERDALRALLEARGRHPGRPPALIASRVIWTDGRPHPMNTPRTKPFARKAERAAAAAAGCLPIRSASFVSILVDAGVCRERGLPQADYFLWNDDFEFTTRLLRGQAGLLCPASVVVHKTATFGGTDVDPGPRFFYEVRNKVWTLRTAAARPGRARPVRRARRCAAGPARSPGHATGGARVVTGQGPRRRGADEPAADRGGARVGGPDGAGPTAGPGRSLTPASASRGCAYVPLMTALGYRHGAGASTVNVCRTRPRFAPGTS